MSAHYLGGSLLTGGWVWGVGVCLCECACDRGYHLCMRRTGTWIRRTWQAAATRRDMARPCPCSIQPAQGGSQTVRWPLFGGFRAANDGKEKGRIFQFSNELRGSFAPFQKRRLIWQEMCHSYPWLLPTTRLKIQLCSRCRRWAAHRMSPELAARRGPARCRRCRWRRCSLRAQCDKLDA